MRRAGTVSVRWIFVCVCFTSFIINLERDEHKGFKLWIQIDQADFADWISFPPSNRIEEISSNPEALSTNT